jgi:phosphohistidine phosphatase
MLWLLRHAEAAEGRPDEARPLTRRGVSDAQAIAVALVRMGVQLDACLTSPKRRALETAHLACAEQNIEPVLEPELIHGGYDPERLALGLGETLIVGHNPTIAAAVRQLTGARVNMPPGTLAAIERGELLLLLTPAQTGLIADAEAVRA